MGCGYLPTGYLPTGYLPTGYLPIGAAATGGGSLRGKSAAAATLIMATSPAATIMIVFMMLIPLFVHPARADRVTPLFRFVCARRPLLPSHIPAQSPGEWLPIICRLGWSNGSNAIGRIGTVVSGSGLYPAHDAPSKLVGRYGALLPLFRLVGVHCIAAFVESGQPTASPQRSPETRGLIPDPADNRHRRLLRARRERPCQRRPAEQRYELAPPDHSITSSASAISI